MFARIRLLPMWQICSAMLSVLVVVGPGHFATAQGPPLREDTRQIIVRAVLLSIEEVKLRTVQIPWEGAAPEKTARHAIARTAVVEAELVEPFLAKLKEQGARVLSRPTLMTLDGQQATVQIGGEALLPIGRIGDLDETPDRLHLLTFGTTLTVTPRCLSAERVLLELCIENTARVEGEKESRERRPAFAGARKRRFTTAEVLRSGQAVLLAIPQFADANDKTGESTTLVACLEVEPLARKFAQAVAAPSEVELLREELRELRGIVSQLAKQTVRTTTPPPAVPARPRIERAVAVEPVEAAQSRSENLLTKVYNVADLVISIPDGAAHGGNRFVKPRTTAEEQIRPAPASESIAEPTAQPRPTRAQFAPLIGLITANVTPDSWKESGGNCAIQSLERNLSLVILQTESGHERISQIIEKLRWLQDHTMLLEIEVVSATNEACERAELDVTSEGRTLSPPRAKHVREALLSRQESKIDTAPRITIFNKQLCEIRTTLSAGREFHLIVQGALEDDLETVRLNLAVNAQDAADAVRASITSTVFSGETLVLDITQRLRGTGNEVGVPILDKIPHVEKLFKNVGSTGSGRTLLFVTPRVQHERDTTGE